MATELRISPSEVASIILAEKVVITEIGKSWENGNFWDGALIFVGL
jgi:hypothetical protein